MRFCKLVVVLLLSVAVLPAAHAIDSKDPNTRFALIRNSNSFPFVVIKMYLYDPNGKLVYRWKKNDKRRVLWRWKPGPNASHYTIRIRVRYGKYVRWSPAMKADRNICFLYKSDTGNIYIERSYRMPNGEKPCTPS
jgi:hypothetical protein